MFTHCTSIVARINLLLLTAYLVFSIMLVLYIIIRDWRAKRRIQRLLRIKHDLFTLLLAPGSSDVCVPSIENATAADFIDVVTNRQRYSVFFNESEQQLFKECFVNAGKIKMLGSLAKKKNKKWRRIDAIVALGYIQDESALDALEKSLRSKDEDVSYFSAQAIGQVSTMRSVNMLMDFLKTTPSMRRKTASILESLSPNITDEIIKFADDKDPEVRVWAAKLLSKSVSKQYIKKVAAMTGDPSPDVRAAACESLARLEDKDSKGLLEKLLKDDSWFVRMYAVRAISRIFGKDAMPELIEQLNDGSLLVIESVKQAMVDHIEAALPYIIKLLKGTDELAKKICAEALDQSGRAVSSILNKMNKPAKDNIMETIRSYNNNLAERIISAGSDEI